ncbi:hypothetical protein K491DRAFT_761458 [Lophiostoma macrostomum CBS 122681]|uniref:Uncharacterized protein n=1 Tax=Lophiostoma macrostomum CBS 122681 TaxID=1314788 RepID=A0A6A6SV32_9PLEO|nr:hypothetical protein K491DRAFT_761458 [Lophiostoma macrostomum CBS 122681]
MKVVEKGTNRWAQVHLHARGVVNPLDEFGEWVDPTDDALCCFVPVEAGQKVKVEGRFAGTTKDIQFDVSIDGICRKAHTIISKAVQAHKSKKIGFDKFLFHTKDGIINTEIFANDVPSGLKFEDGETATIGVIELRLCIIRRLGDEHALRDAPVYYEHIDEGLDVDAAAVYSSIVPQFTMTFDKDVQALDKTKSAAWQRKMQAKRPGDKPWAIFRFHYRTKQSILENELEPSFCAADKKYDSPYTLEIEELPMLDIPQKPAKAGESEEASTRHSSPAASVAETLPKSTAEARERSSSPQTTVDATEEERAQLMRNFVDSPPKALLMPPPSSTGVVHQKVTDDGSEDTTGKDVVKSTETTITEKIDHGNTSTTTITTASTTTNTTLTAPSTPTKRTAELTPPNSPLSKRAKPSPLSLPPISPQAFSLSSPSLPPTLSSPRPSSPTPTPTTLERQLATTRARLASARAKRAKIAEQQAAIDARLAPYRQRIKEELEQMERLVELEEKGGLEAEENLRAGLEALEGFRIQGGERGGERVE